MLKEYRRKWGKGKKMMKLSYEQVVSITQGAVKVERKENSIQFHRFTEEQEKVYAASEYHPKQYATAGVRLHFKTDSTRLFMKMKTSQGSSRKFFAHDVLVDGKFVGSLKNKTEDCYGVFEESFALGEGTKTVCIHFPWSVCSMLEELSLDDGSFIEPVKREKKILIFGDSITQGYDAADPMNRYAANLADALEAEEINKAIGGEKFCPWLAEMRDDIEPDYISVAYGTNHWHRASSEEFREICETFFDKLVHNYPNAKIFAITPIWRKDRTDETRFKYFEEIGEIICDVVKKYNNVKCISGRNFIPEDEKYFSDLYLHPNDEGFKFYSDGIRKAIQ